MRRQLLGAMVATLLSGAPTLGDEQAGVRAILDKAIQALGGETNLSKFKAATWKGKGKFNVAGQDLEFTGEWFVQPPDQMKTLITNEFNGMVFKQVRVVNGDKGWFRRRGWWSALRSRPASAAPPRCRWSDASASWQRSLRCGRAW